VRRTAAWAAALVLACTPAVTLAQVASPRTPDPQAKTHVAPVELFQWRFVGEVALGTAASLLVVPFDGRVRSWVQAPARQQSSALGHAVNAVMPFGSAVPLVAAAAVYGVGRLAGRSTLADVGLHAGEAMAGAAATTVFLKVLVGRARPYVEPHDPHAFGKGRPLALAGRYESFPSGHATVAFALAGALTEETAWHWPGRQRVVAPFMYAVATGVAFARVYRDRHWASDVLGGAVVGTLVSRRVVQALHTGGAGPFSHIDPILLPRSGGGATVGLSVVLR
jgi:membrane-associated phospholipid phosphatase